VAQHEAGKSRRVCGLDSDTVHSKLTLYPIIYDVIRHKTVILPYPFFSRMLVYTSAIHCLLPDTAKASIKQIKMETPERMHVTIHTCPPSPHQISFCDLIVTMVRNSLVLGQNNETWGVDNGT
jgi:hypothetical protein